ncbi:LOW QUALITY PROTEIN: sperm microtubule associated protein 2 [Panthera onca]|uniref:LOW QUALITY PROTEIN: sperm microtubule associated protein 2 n=1 Tax=Panthera onca TaxID=9690 RepID=UPI002953DA60|nr:LOW QUALITY PROTEIN: sperm microtubule associated protein 2 [Panthera onca]
MERGPRECECGRAILLLPGDRDHRHTWVLGSKAAGLGRTQYMGDRRRSLSHSHHSSEAEGGPDWGQDDDALGVQGTVFRSPGTKDTTCLDDEELSFEDREAETLPEEVTGGEPPGPRAPEEALEPLERVLEKDAEGIPEMSRLSITQRLPSAVSARGMRRRRKRVFELAKPKTNWQVLKDRMGCCCKGYAWVSPCKRNLQFCVYWPSVYWSERFLEDTTLTVTVPAVTRRVEELARPKRFYSEYFNNNRSTSVWPVPRPTLEYQASSRLRELATPRVRNNIWSINMSEVSQVSKAAQMAIPSTRILRLAKPRAPATLLEEWDPMPKPKPHVSDYNRLLHLAMPKAQSDQCVPDRDPRWEVLDVTKKAVASPRIISLAKPKVRKDLNEGYDPYHISPASLVAQASPRLYELATPKSITKRV